MGGRLPADTSWDARSLASSHRDVRPDLSEYVTPAVIGAHIRIAEPNLYVEVSSCRRTFGPQERREHRRISPGPHGLTTVLLVDIQVFSLARLVQQVCLARYVTNIGDQDVAVRQQPVEGRLVIRLHRRLENGIELGNVVGTVRRARVSGGTRDREQQRSDDEP